MKYICGLSTRYIRTTEIHNCVRPKCNLKFPIARQKNKKRKNGHQKDINCPKCNQKITMTEVY